MAQRLLETLVASENSEGREETLDDLIPSEYWMARPAESGADSEEQLSMRGAVLLQVRGRNNEAAGTAMSKDLQAVLSAPASRPSRELWRLLKRDGVLAPMALTAALGVTAAGTILEAVLLQGLIDIGSRLILVEQRLLGLGALLLLSTLLLIWEAGVASGAWRVGRKLEARLRLAFLKKVPRLGDRYFHSRLISDMTERSHQVHQLRTLPEQGARLVRASFELCFTALGIIWLMPQSGAVIGLVVLLMLGVPITLQRRLIEGDLRIRNHNGALTRFYLDAMLGLTAIRAHGADRPLRHDAEGVFAEWRGACFDYLKSEVFVVGVGAIIGAASSIWLLSEYRLKGDAQSGVLLLVYWALQLPVLGEEIAQLAQQYPRERNITLRLLEPLGAPEEPVAARTGKIIDKSEAGLREEKRDPGVAIAFAGVRVQAAGHGILDGLDLEIAAGSHVAIVGPSGAGKSSLVGLLLGWHRAAEGHVLVDGEELTIERLTKLRTETVWVDPTVQLWNRTMLENLVYGNERVAPSVIQEAVESAVLSSVLEKLPDGLQTVLGEGGRLLSGGEGQRVRFGRAALKAQARLVILDEPFRGLDRTQRRKMMSSARRLWSQATLLCITHDVRETLDFPRVLVIEGGRVVEDGPASQLAERKGSRYRALIDAEIEVRSKFWAEESWRRLRLTKGRIKEETGSQTIST
jgi:ABC-type multidrug transport system fused ATPase/permease subunit